MKPTKQELEKLRTYAPGLLIKVALEEIYKILKREIPDLIKDIFKLICDECKKEKKL